MKRTWPTILSISVLVLALAAGTQPASAQPADVVNSIEEALNSGNVSKLLSHGSDRIAVAVFGAAREYSQAQAEYVLKDFFKTHRVKSFSFDESSDTDRGKFVQGRLRYAGSDKALQVFVRLRMKRGEWELREIIIRR
jgi:hypothetical protein